MGFIDDDVAGLTVDECDGGAFEAAMLGDDPEHRGHHIAEIHTAVKNLADFEKKLQLPDLVAVHTFLRHNTSLKVWHITDNLFPTKR